MYRLLLVDDEQIERIYLSKLVTSHFPSITQIDEAKNGQEAIKAARDHKPDIIIMDIKMPLKNGLEACQEIRKFSPKCKIAIISAYDNFDYAQTAIKLSAIEYLLKPVRPSILISTLTKIIESLNLERVKEEEDKKLKEQLWEHMLLVKNSFILDLLNGDIFDEEEVRRKSEFLNIRINPSTVFLINIKACSDENPSEIKKQYYKQQVIAKLYKQFNLENIFVTYTGSGNFILLYGKNEDVSDTKHIDIAIAESLIEALSEKGKNIVTVGIGNYYPAVLDISQSYLEAKKAVLYRDDSGSQTIHISNITGEQAGINEYKKKRILSLLTSGHKTDVINLIKNIISEAKRDSDLSEYKFFFMQIFIIDLFQRLDSISFKIESLKEINRISECRDIAELERYVLKCINNLYEQQDKAKDQYYKSIIEKVKKYLEENIDANITLDMISRQVHLSSFYLSRLFKAQTKMNFITYLNMVRIKKSIELLEKTNLNAEAIAEKVGYNNTSYYCRIFKKHTGLTPIEWRKKWKR